MRLCRFGSGSPRYLLLRGALVAAFLCAAVGMSFGLQKLQAVGPAAASQSVEFDVFLPLQHADQLDQLLTEQQTPGSANYHKWITPQQFRAKFGPSAAVIQKVSSTLQGYGLTVTATHSQGVHVQGQVSAVENAFGIRLLNAVASNGRHALMTSQQVFLPAALQEAGAQVVHFSPIIRQHVHAMKGAPLAAAPENRYSAIGPYWFDDLKQAYSYPSYKVLTGKGRTIGILMSSDFLDSDIAAYFAHEKLTAPKVLRRPVLGGAPFDPNSGASFEVELDIQQSGGMAPNSTIVVYNIPDLSDASILAGYLSIVEDNTVDIVNSSFGGAEGFYTPPYNGGVDFTGILKVYDDLFKQGNAQGITLVASSGDSGGLGLPTPPYLTATPTNPPSVVAKFVPGIETPASSPHVTAVGGTNLVTTFTTGSLNSAYVSENANGDPEVPYDPYGVGNLVSGGYWGSGGGKSIYYAKPAYQNLVKTGSKTRTIPDLSLHMGGCPGGISVLPCGPDRSYDVLAFDGALYGVIGTSASSPDFVGLLALKEEWLGGTRLGNENFEIYSLAAAQNARVLPFTVYRNNIPGFNGFYHATKGYNLVLGNGTLFGKDFALAPKVPSAGVPQTPTNP